MVNQDFMALAQATDPVPVPDSKPMPVPVPGTPVTISIDPVALVNGIADCYKNVAIAREEQRTLRTQIREQSRVCIAAIEANTKEFELALGQAKIERMQFIQVICDLIRQDGIDEYSLKYCEKVLDYLTNTNPMNNAGKALGFSGAAAGMIGRRG